MNPAMPQPTDTPQPLREELVGKRVLVIWTDEANESEFYAPMEEEIDPIVDLLIPHGGLGRAIQSLRVLLSYWYARNAGGAR